MAKGIPTDRSRRYKANQEKKSSSPATTGNDVFPSPPISPITQAEGAERAFSLARILIQSLLHTATPGTHPHDLLINLAPALSNHCIVLNGSVNPKLAILPFKNNLMTLIRR